jgi:hypothetical protein
MNHLFSVTYRPGPTQAPLSLVCQSMLVSGEMLLWIDGINLEQPVLAPLSAVKQIRHLGTFRDFAQARLPLAHAVLQESQGEHSPALIARAIQYLEADAGLSAHDALELAYEQALDLVDADNNAGRMFTQARDLLAAGAAA